jgi:hypothetical protein
MAFQIPLDHKEKWYIAQFPELSHGDAARSLNRLFKRINNGTRSRIGVYLFRQTAEYRDLRAKVEEKERNKTVKSGKTIA